MQFTRVSKICLPIHGDRPWRTFVLMALPHGSDLFCLLSSNIQHLLWANRKNKLFSPKHCCTYCIISLCFLIRFFDPHNIPIKQTALPNRMNTRNPKSMTLLWTQCVIPQHSLISLFPLRAHLNQGNLLLFTWLIYTCDFKPTE
jgi:hypothetical protein